MPEDQIDRQNPACMTSPRHSLCLLALLIALIQPACSRQPPPPPAPPPPAQPAVNTTQDRTDEEKEQDAIAANEKRLLAIAAHRFSLYHKKLQETDLPRAEAALRELRAAFTSDADYVAFWENSIPPSKRATLILMSLCESCKGGICNTCKGVATCKLCAGSGKCGHCDERPVRQHQCTACICSTCTGTGRCVACKGFRSSPCQNCSGNGTVTSATTTECRRCGGTGSTPGLRNASGVIANLTCLTCKGSGRIPSRVITTCSACAGKGSISCTSCASTGRCTACQGAGRIKSCSVCSGAGFTLHKCPQCAGDGKCTKCAGSGSCGDCHGTGKCVECAGGLVTLYNLPVHTDWMTTKQGHILYDSRRRRIADKDEKNGEKQIQYQNITLNLKVQSGQIVFIATQPDFGSLSEIIHK